LQPKEYIFLTLSVIVFSAYDTAIIAAFGRNAMVMRMNKTRLDRQLSVTRRMSQRDCGSHTKSLSTVATTMHCNTPVNGRSISHWNNLYLLKKTSSSGKSYSEEAVSIFEAKKMIREDTAIYDKHLGESRWLLISLGQSFLG